MFGIFGYTECSFMSGICPVCKKTSSLYFRVGDVNRRITKEKFDYFRCQSCGLIFVRIPDNLDAFYPNNYYSIPQSLQQLEAGAKGERYKIEIVKRFAASGRLLEIGPAYGSFAFLAKQEGFVVEAIELDADCCRFLEHVVGVKAINSADPSEALMRAESYDVITLWHVIEHLPNPWSTLTAIAQKLRPGGVLVIAAPNPSAFQFKVLGRYWPHVDAPRHLALIPLPLLKRHLQPLNVYQLWSTTADRGTLGWNIFGWEVFFANMSNRRFLNRRLRKIGRLLSKVMGPFDRMDGRGSAYTVVFKKGQQ